jgi:hypothetical protein
VTFFFDAFVNFWAMRGVMKGDVGSAFIAWTVSDPFAWRLAYATRLGEKLVAM